MKNSNNIAILILAAGESTRMGVPKQLLPWRKTTLLGTAISTAESVCKGNVYVVLGAHAEKIEQAHIAEGTIFIYNSNYKLGLGASLSRGIDYLIEGQKSYKGVMVLLCDQPLISSKYLNRLIHTFEKNEKGIIATDYGKRAGVPAIFAQEYFKELARITGDKGAKEIIDQNRDIAVLLDSEGSEIDLDTKFEYEQLLKKLSN